jgi:hypothetical protein
MKGPVAEARNKVKENGAIQEYFLVLTAESVQDPEVTWTADHPWQVSCFASSAGKYKTSMATNHSRMSCRYHSCLPMACILGTSRKKNDAKDHNKHISRGFSIRWY